MTLKVRDYDGNAVNTYSGSIGGEEVAGAKITAHDGAQDRPLACDVGNGDGRGRLQIVSGYQPVTQFMTAQPSNVNRQSGEIDLRLWKSTWMEIELKNTGNPIGSLSIQGGLRSGSLKVFRLSEGDLSPEAGVSLDTNGVIQISGVTATIALQLAFIDPPPYMAFLWVPTGGSGSSGDQLNAWWFARGL